MERWKRNNKLVIRIRKRKITMPKGIYKRTKKHCENISKGNEGISRGKGRISPMKGRHQSDKAKEKI